ncbi:hypothetical protein FRC03_000970 [Tulasnella sp. 419]|nr:hypothetical protein FRC03_000970 [Tulasnella sp. 419]
MNSPLLTDILHIDSLADNSKLLWHSPQLHSPTDASAPDWSLLTMSSTLSGGGCIPGGLAQISALSPTPSRSPSPPPKMTTISLDSIHSNIKPCAKSPPASGNPHPYSISPSNTTALFTRASSVSSTGAPGKKSRAPPSGPISTKDFIPPDVSGLSKREARLVKNRAAAFLSRQRKREEFEGLESRVDQLEAENARLRAAQNNPASLATASSQDIASLKAQHAQELAALHASYSAQLNTLNNDVQSLQLQLDTATKTNEATEAKLNEEIQRLNHQLNQRSNDEEDDSDSSSEDGEEELDSKKSRNGPGSVALMVLLLSLSNLLTNGRKSTASTTTPGTSSSGSAPNQPRRVSHHARRSSTSHFLPTYTSSSSLSRPSPYASGSYPYEGLASGFGFEYDANEPFSIESLLNTPPSHHPFSSGMVDDDFAMMEEMLGKSPKMMKMDDDDDFLMTSTAASPGASSVATMVPQLKDDPAAQLGISGIVPTGPGSFEFDFTVPSSLSSSSSSKIKVSVKSKSQLGSLRPGDVMESPVKFQPDDLDSFTFGNSWSIPTQDASSKKRKLVFEVQPSSEEGGSKKRKISGSEKWEVVVSSADDSSFERSHPDVKMEVEI